MHIEHATTTHAPNHNFNHLPSTPHPVRFHLLRWASALFLVCPPLHAAAQTPAKAATAPNHPASVALAENYGKLPLSFEANQGQSDKSVRFLSRGNGYSLFLTDSAAVLTLSKREQGVKGDGFSRRAGNLKTNAAGRSGSSALTESAEGTKADVIRMSLANANPNAHVIGTDQFPGTANYFIGNDPGKWHADIPIYAKVKYTSVYPGIDLVYYGNQRQLEYDFVVAPHADPSRIALHFDGATKLNLTKSGDLEVQAENGQIAFRAPVLYQEIEGHRQPVQGHFTLEADNKVSFTVGDYNRSQSLIVDPVLVYSTYLGGSGGGFGNYYGDGASSIAIDPSGNAYITGFTYSKDFPVPSGSKQPTNNERANGAPTAFVTKIDPAGGSIIYSTYLGGTGGGYAGQGDFGYAIAVDSAGHAYVTGGTFSSDFPTSSTALQTSNKGFKLDNTNAFVTKLETDGKSFLYSTYLGGSGIYTGNAGSGGERGTGIAIDSDGNAYVAGLTWSTDFQLAGTPIQNHLPAKNVYAGFVSKINPTGTSLVYSTYLGGTGGDFISGVALDSARQAYVVGTTYSNNFPTKNPIQARNLAAPIGESNLFVSSINADGSALIYSTYLGGNGHAVRGHPSYGDSGNAIAVDSSGSAYVTGSVYSRTYPTTTCALQNTNYGYENVVPTAVVSKLTPKGDALMYSTYLGGSGFPGAYHENSGGDSGNAISIDSAGNAYLTGSTLSADFPITQDAYQSSNSGTKNDLPNAFITQLDASGAALLYSSYLGGSGSLHGGGDQGLGLQADSDGNVYLTGSAGSGNFPVTAGVLQNQNNSNGDSNAFIAKFSLGLGTELAGTFTQLALANPQVKLGATAVFTASTATCSAPAGNPALLGSVSFSVDGVAVPPAIKIGNGKAIFSTNKLTIGLHNITANYLGDANYAPSTSSKLALNVYGPPAQIVPTAGSPQSAIPYGSVFATPLKVLVTDANHSPVPGATVVFTGPGLHFIPTSVVTDSNGNATTTAKAAAAGDLLASATVAGVLKSADFKLQANVINLSLKADNKIVLYNKPIPPLTYTLTGFVNGDTSSAVTGTPVETTTAKQGSNFGVYPIVIAQGSLKSPNYTFLPANGTVTITPLGKTQTPVFAPGTAIYHSAPTITITSTTPKATIYYTIDGTVPTTASYRYLGPIRVVKTTTFRAIAVAVGYNPSSVTQAVYNIHLPPLVTTKPANGILATQAILNSSINDESQAARVSFLYGTSATALNKTTGLIQITASPSYQSVPFTLTGLTSKTTYYYQAVTQNLGGTGSGAVLSFTTK